MGALIIKVISISLNFAKASLSKLNPSTAGVGHGSKACPPTGGRTGGLTDRFEPYALFFRNLIVERDFLDSLRRVETSYEVKK
ncbi:hypothetical protein NC796_22135 [Aliifodinibius sp. S!AR15-10]|uniref:hypothetical protein n=1 Tax=Aliifodinibius sp. S!AR15-10 TaxID=2950437 RepID=UPI002864B3A3|nr:hypothetical protein [Aliifodinibius sp. S!AR15-10]MDR8393869.1 hypothetical protein [Aliifodinibius sp. S!AR15-10]